MLKTHKTFDLDRERVSNQPKHEKLYEPKKCKYLKYVVIPALIAFVLLCILVNVDFTGEAYKCSKTEIKIETDEIILTIETREITKENSGESLNSSSEKTTYEENTDDLLESTTEFDRSNENRELKQKMRPLPMIGSSTKSEDGAQEITPLPKAVTFPNTTISFNPFAASAANCVPNQANCSLYCSDGSVNYIDEDLEDLRFKCPYTDMTLIIQHCEFDNGILTSALLVGDFSLEYISITDSNLQTIKALAFKQATVKNLKTLILRNNLLITLTATSFDGLGALQYFEFVQAPLWEGFIGEGFLKPMAASLTEALIVQMTYPQEVIDPKNWLQGSELSKLITLNMSHNNFQNILEALTFRPLNAIENLSLANCSLSTITADIFLHIKDTLKYVDLSDNQLQTFDLPFLNLMAAHSIEVNFMGNEWNCDCENNEVMEFFQENTELMETIVCKAPEKWDDRELKDVVEECTQDMNSSTTSDPPSPTTTDATTEDSTSSLPSTESSTPSTTTTDSSLPTTSSPTINSTSSITNSTSSTTDIISTTNGPDVTDESSENSPDIKPVVCYSSNETETLYWFYQPTFRVSTTSENSVAIKLPDSLKKFDILCFTNYSNSRNLTQLHHSISNNIVIIMDLIPGESYIFCLITDPLLPVSPLQCQGHFIGVLSKPWLLTKDQHWLIPVIIISCLIFIFAAGFAIYVLLRNYPTWLLNRNRRILKVNNCKYKVILLSRETYKTEDSERSSDYLKANSPTPQNIYGSSDKTSLYTSQHVVPRAKAPSLPPILENRKSSCPSYNTAQRNEMESNYLSIHFNRFQSLKDDKITLYDSQHKVPAVNAPKAKTRSSYNKSQNCMQSIDDDPEYQTIDHYEIVDF